MKNRIYFIAIFIAFFLNRVEAREVRDSVTTTSRGDILLLTTLPSYTTTQNYVVEKVFLDPSTTTSSPRVINNVVYLDGFGRKLQEIQVGGSPGGTADIIRPYVYGVQGRVEKEYLPYNKEGNNGAFDKNVMATSNWNIYGATDAPYAFTKVDFDNSPLDRIVKKTGPGKNWHITGNGKGVVSTYGTNIVNEVRLYRVASSGNLEFDNSYYAVGSLRKITLTDEDGNKTETFTDRNNNVVLVVSFDDSDRMETYSVYDERGLLRYVLSPEASIRLQDSFNETVLLQFAYRYDYDSWGRLIMKRLPGCDPVYMVYDKRDRLVMSQDGKQRSEDVNKWSYSLYDNLNRVVETGEIISAVTQQSALQAMASVSDNYIPQGNRFPLQYTLYDNYAATTNVPVLPFQATTGYATEHNQWVAGLVTSVKTKVLGLGVERWLTTTTYYDDRCRVIQTVSDNLYGQKSRVDLKYDFTGNVTYLRESHQVSDSQTDVLETVSIYDTRKRLLSVITNLNGGDPVSVIYTYDAVGRQIGKTIGSITETMTYNVRGWLMSKDSRVFNMKLRYEVPQGGAAACWNGNISEWEWQQGTGPVLMYGFAYDGVNRLTGTTQKQKSDTSWVTLMNSYLEDGITYDYNGNIKTLHRTSGGVPVDNLMYIYSGNQLTSLIENIRTSPKGDVYLPGDVAVGTYTYDKNGNMIIDSRRTLNFTYNVLNLLSEVKMNNILKASYNYLADGTKLRVRDNGEANGFDYLGSLTYRKSSAGLQLELANFSNGVILPSNTKNSQDVNYFFTDHLGSVRVILDRNGEFVEQNDYYPFGTKYIRSDYLTSDNRYKYNGQEEQVLGDLKYLDYGARMYDCELARWLSIDPKLERYVNISPYGYCANNPIVLIDMGGEYIDPASLAAWNTLTNEVNDKRNDMKELIDYLRVLLDNIKPSNPMYDLIVSMYENAKTRVSFLDNIIASFNILEESEQKYSLEELKGTSMGYVEYSSETGAIVIKYFNITNFVHEVTHAAQYETQDIGFHEKNGKTFMQDVYDEVAAYRSQYAFDPLSINGLNPTNNPRGLGYITAPWVQGIFDPIKGKIYAPGGYANMGAYPININSTREDLLKAYPNLMKESLPESMKQIPNLKYKRK
ncbi:MULTISPECIES: RHS repeat domain-containing protein [Butyricimonas]|uniref:RHS repeat domain-containing protein n=1 Tax=Butyricimonas TaxID=574697 RepID=UPI0007FB4A78|nr:MULTISPECIES: DUF6443 domain-containing protein [Butyricimonas]